MAGPAQRRFTLLDAMVLVAATAAGLAASRAYLTTSRRMLGFEPLPIAYWTAAGERCLLAWAVALIVLRLRPPRTHPRRRFRHPGDASCLATMVGAAFVAGFIGLFLIKRALFLGHVDRWFTLLSMDLSPTVAPAIAAVWVTMALGGRWRRCADWIDGTGRALGTGWLAAFLVSKLAWLY